MNILNRAKEIKHTGTILKCFNFMLQISVVFSLYFVCLDTSIRDGLFHEYKKCGKVMSVSISGEKEDRYAIVTFKK